MSKNFDLDLDALAGKSEKIKLGGEIIEVKQPSLVQLVKLVSAGNRLQSMDESSITEKEAEEAINLMSEVLIMIVPELKGKHLTIRQMFALFDLIQRLAIPKDLEELEKRGVKLSSDQKKILSDSLKK